MKKILSFSLLTLLPLLSVWWIPDVFASDVVPTGDANNFLYYKIGGGSDFALPPVQNTQTINLGADADLGAGYTCGAFNPALSIKNTLNDLKNSVDNIEQTVLHNATGSIAEMPMYFLAQASPTAYNLLNNMLMSAHDKISVSTKACEQVKYQIAHGQNPYQDWATISVNDQWKKHLSMTATGDEDINDAKKEVDANAGNQGAPWVQGNKDSSSGGYYAGGLNQPPIQVVADTVKAGYNAMLLRDLNDNSPAPKGGGLATAFPQPIDAANWITNVVGDQTITTCNDASCKKAQSGISGRGLLPWITTCSDQNNKDCTDTIRTNLSHLITGQSTISKDNLEAVSASGLVMSPQVISAIRGMDTTQQSIIVNKLAQEVATQRVIEKALIARNILQTGSQVPVIATNKPAQAILNQSIQHLDKDIQSLAFEAQVRKQMMSDTLSNVLNYQSNQQISAMRVPHVTPTQPLMQNSAVPSGGQK